MNSNDLWSRKRDADDPIDYHACECGSTPDVSDCEIGVLLGQRWIDSVAVTCPDCGETRRVRAVVRCEVRYTIELDSGAVVHRSAIQRTNKEVIP